VLQLSSSSDPAFSNAPYTRNTLPNELDMAQFPSRPAVEFLEDIINRFKTLEWLPGGFYSEDYQGYNQLKDLYITSGWPSMFDAEKFDLLRHAADDVELEYHDKTEPLQKLRYRVMFCEQEVKLKKEIPKIEAELTALETKCAESSTEELMNEIQRKRADLMRVQLSFGRLGLEHWVADQKQMETKLKEIKKERQWFINRQGRFFEVTDAEHEKAITKNRFDDMVTDLETQIAAPGHGQRFMMGLVTNARAVPEDLRERWFYDKIRYEHYTKEWEHEMRSWLQIGE
jgi:hypothetical protein